MNSLKRQSQTESSRNQREQISGIVTSVFCMTRGEAGKLT